MAESRFISSVLVEEFQSGDGVVTFARPAGMRPGDRLVVVLIGDMTNTATGSPAPDFTFPDEDWELIVRFDSSFYCPPAPSVLLAAFTKVLGEGEPEEYTFSVDGNFGYGGVFLSALALAYRYVGAVLATAGMCSETREGGLIAVTVPAMENEFDSLAVYAWGSTVDASSVTLPSTLTERVIENGDYLVLGVGDAFAGSGVDAPAEAASFPFFGSGAQVGIGFTLELLPIPVEAALPVSFTPSLLEARVARPFPDYALESLRARFLHAATTDHALKFAARAAVQMAFETNIRAPLSKSATLAPGVASYIVATRRRWIDVDADMTIYDFLYAPALTALSGLGALPDGYVRLLRGFLEANYPVYRMSGVAAVLCFAAAFFMRQEAQEALNETAQVVARGPLLAFSPIDFWGAL